MQSFATAVCCRTLYERDTMMALKCPKMLKVMLRNCNVLHMYCVKIFVVYLVQQVFYYLIQRKMYDCKFVVIVIVTVTVITYKMQVFIQDILRMHASSRGHLRWTDKNRSY